MSFATFTMVKFAPPRQSRRLQPRSAVYSVIRQLPHLMSRASDTTLGHKLRSRRERMGLTLTALAARSGVSAAMLSEVKRDRKSPTLRVATQIAEGLGCAVSDLLVECEGDGVVIQKRRQRRQLVDSSTGIERQVLAPRLLRHGVEVVWYVVPEGQTSEQFPGHRRGVVAHATIVRGVLESTTPLGRQMLRAGDSMTYPSGMAHRFRNAGRGVCEFLLVVDASSSVHASRSEKPLSAKSVSKSRRPRG